MKTTHAIAIFGAAALLCGCGGRSSGSGSAKEFNPPAGFPSELGPALFPLVKGNTWTYAVTLELTAGNGSRGPRSGEVTISVSKVEGAEGNQTATLEVTVAGESPREETVAVNSKGVAQLSAGTGTGEQYSPPQPELVFGTAVGKTFTWSGSGPMFGAGFGQSRLITSTVMNPELIYTQQEEQKQWAIPVRAEGVFTARDLKSGKEYPRSAGAETAYWVPGVGLAREYTQFAIPGVAEGTQTLVLKKFVAGGKAK